MLLGVRLFCVSVCNAYRDRLICVWLKYSYSKNMSVRNFISSFKLNVANYIGNNVYSGKNSIFMVTHWNFLISLDE